VMPVKRFRNSRIAAFRIHNLKRHVSEMTVAFKVVAKEKTYVAA
jgi:hypothetical protein